MAFDLSKHCVLVTGAAGMLGVQHSIALARAGAKVIMTDIDKDKLRVSAELVEELACSRVLFFQLDVSCKKQVDSLKNELIDAGVHVSRLINNASINPIVSKRGIEGGEAGRLEDFDPDRFIQEARVGLIGAVNCTSIFGPEMARKKDGAIINVASDLSVIAPDQSLYRVQGRDPVEQYVKPISYSIIKHGLIGLTKYITSYWGDRNVRSNALSPGGVYVDQPDLFVSKISKLIPLGRMARQDEYHGVVQFLCSEEAQYLNGQNIVMDGGRSAL